MTWTKSGMSSGGKVCLDPGLLKVRLVDIAKSREGKLYQTDVQRGHMTSPTASS